MGTLYLVRHGQASFGADDYDQLSELGQRQSLRLGQYLRWCQGDALRLDAVLTGTLRRQRQTWDGIAAGAGLDVVRTEWPGLNEYDSHAVIQAIQPGPLGKADTPELYRQHFRLLREGLKAWMDGRTQPVGMPSYADFYAGVVGALDHVRSLAGQDDAQVMIVSSGGPIATAVGHVLGLAPEVTIELNLRIRNSAVTEFQFNPKRHTLISFNTLAHLDGPDYRGWVTSA